MSRPRPLSNFSSAVPSHDDYTSLTPRTPHSRAGNDNGDDTFAKLQVSDGVEWEDMQGSLSQQQSAPLLHSSRSADFRPGVKSAKKDYHQEPLSHVSRFLLTGGILLAGLLLLLVVISWTRPDSLHRYLGLDLDSFGGFQPQFATWNEPGNVPKRPLEYFDQCNKLMSNFMPHGRYWDVMPGKVMEAHDQSHGQKQEEGVCSGSMTYMLDGRVGLAADLALMAQVAAMARERNNTFFVDDTYWNRGRWLDHFEDVRVGQPGPEPGCKPPPAQALAACPRTAKHWVVNSVTAKFHLGHGFSDNYENPFGHDLNRLKPIYEKSRYSFLETIRPNAHSRKLINLAKQELTKAFTTQYELPAHDETATSAAVYVGVHIRRGDRIPMGWKYHQKPIPTEVYAEAVTATWKRLHEEASDIAPAVYLASDSPDSIKQFASLVHGPLFSLKDSKLPDLKSIASDKEYSQKPFGLLPLKKRVSLTRGALVDLALISGLWDSEREAMLLDATVCSVSSNFCRLAAIGLSWEDAFGDVNDMGDIDETWKRWVDVDVEGKVIPVWTAFELF
ncbi:hypothetical protein BKA70DRAFT_1251302 [Coprinopsis sp. MPI-PUGE-AT-0042]|nr:hypothetical protein BKA70DRAFT_1251302 [Coprinopsis sp. MPI-PUGE-AT-0042]